MTEVLRGLLTIGLAVVTACESEPPDPFLPLLEKHAGIGEPGPDTSNKYALDPAVVAFGKKLYFDPYFSGNVLGADMLLQPSIGRHAVGQPVNVSCNTCHDVTKGGSDPTVDPGNYVSFGAGAYDVNSQQSINSGFMTDLVYWNGRNDSLWSQIIAVVESHVSVNGSRMRVAWRIVDKYKSEYETLFPDYPLPALMDSIAAQKARLEPDGTCTLVGSVCPPECHMDPSNQFCLPRFPLEARPGFVEFGELAVCDWGTTDEIKQPYKDAWDCMAISDQLLATRVYVNFAKAVAAYEFALVSKDSAFDKWADAAFPLTGVGALPPAAQRGARLFVGKAACAECHSGPLFTDNQFHNIGIPQLGTYVPTTAECPANGWCDCVSSDSSLPQNCLPIGARDGMRKLQANRFRRDSTWSDDEECRRHFTLHTQVTYAEAHPDECDGRVKYYSMPLTDDLRGQWKTPGLRDVALTPPYMHNGMYKTLREVIVHYNKGGIHDLGGESIGTIDQKIKALNLTDQEIDDLVAFLETLTGQLAAGVGEPPTVPGPSDF